MTRQKKVTIQQVAQLAGVSSTTVSLVLNLPESGAERISQETRQRVMNAIVELGYYPNQAARSLRRRKTERVCLAVSDLGIPYNNLLAKEIFRVANELGYMTIIALMDTPDQERKTLNEMMRGLADGIIFNRPMHLSNEEISRLAQMGCAVCVSSNHLRPEGVDVVCDTEGDAAFSALNYLYQLGHRRIAYIGQFHNRQITYHRHRAYQNFLAARALPVDNRYMQFDPGVSREQAYESVKKFLNLEAPPTAIFAGSDLAAISAIYAIQDRGLRIPEDIAVIGSGNIPEAAIVHPPLTTIGPEKFDFSPLVNFMFSRLQGETPPAGRVHQTEWKLILRKSA